MGCPISRALFAREVGVPEVNANLTVYVAGQPYGTVSVMLLLLVSLPAVALTIIVDVPAGVPLTGICVVVPLHPGCNRSNPNSAHAKNTPRMRRRRCPPTPAPSRVNPGIASQIA